MQIRPISKFPFVLLSDSSRRACFGRGPLGLPDLICRSNPHLALERYRAWAAIAADRGQFGYRSLRPLQSEACFSRVFAVCALGGVREGRQDRTEFR